MYSESSVKCIYYKDDKRLNKDNVVYGQICESIKVDTNNFEHEYWNVRFVGKCLENAKRLNDKDKIIILKCSYRNTYVKDKKRSYPYILIFDFKWRNDTNNNEAFDNINHNI